MVRSWLVLSKFNPVSTVSHSSIDFVSVGHATRFVVSMMN